jgi:hypothetical protein
VWWMSGVVWCGVIVRMLPRNGVHLGELLGC